MLKAAIVLVIAVGCWGFPASTNLPALLDYTKDAELAEAIRYQAEIRDDGRHICSGAVVGMYEILTVASCVFRSSPEDLSVLVGSVNASSAVNVYQVGDMQLHPLFDHTSNDNDFALLKVKKPFPLGRNVDIIEIPEQHEKLEEGVRAMVSGWVLELEGGSLNPLLNAVNVTVIPWSACNGIYSVLGGIGITDSMICSGGLPQSPMKNGCVGDKGAPLVANGKLYGLASWGKGCTEVMTNFIVYSDATTLQYFVRKNIFMTAVAESELCAALQMIVSILPTILSIPKWITASLNVLLSILGCSP